MATREDREFYTRMWEQNKMINNGCGTPFYIALIIGVVLLFSSCATKKHIVENDHQKTEVKVDSTDVQSVKVDSTDTEHKTEIKETEKVETETKVEKSDSTVMTVDAQGNVVKQETWHKEKETVKTNTEKERILRDSISQYKHVVDSLSRFKLKCDSLQEKLLKKEFVTVEKQKNPNFCYATTIFSILVLIFVFIKFLLWLRKR